MHDPNMFTPADANTSLQQAQSVFSNATPEAAQQFASEVQAWANSSAAMKASATSGKFAVDPASGQGYVDLYNRCIDEIETLRPSMMIAVQEYKLGTTPGAKLVAPWNQQVTQELETAFSQLPTVYENARDAYAAAMTHYKENEESVRFTLQQLTNQE
jgi:hypothetical protein